MSRPQNRKGRLVNHSTLVKMNETNPTSTNIFESSVIETFYPQRPADMEDVCLYSFIANMELTKMVM